MYRKQWVIGVALAVALAVPALVGAHEGHAEKVLGTVSSTDGKNLMVKTTAGKTIMVMMDAKTTVMRAKEKLTAADVKVGDRVVAEGAEEQGMLMATSVQLGAAPAATAKDTTAKK